MTRLEDIVSRIEESLVEDYGLVRRCRLPLFDHGVASCNYHDLKPGSVCKSICDAGWIASPGTSIVQEVLYLYDG